VTGPLYATLEESAVRVSVTNKSEKLTKVVRRASLRRSRREVLAAVQAAAVRKVSGGPSAERSQDFLYGDDGMPGVLLR
jgi:hypothetical protein